MSVLRLRNRYVLDGNNDSDNHCRTTYKAANKAVLRTSTPTSVSFPLPPATPAVASEV